MVTAGEEDSASSVSKVDASREPKDKEKENKKRKSVFCEFNKVVGRGILNLDE